MNSKFQIFILLIIITLSSCKTVPVTQDGSKLSNIDQSEKVKDHSPILDIWKKTDGSVPIRGESLYFRLYDDGNFEFDYIVSRKTEPEYSNRLTFTQQRNPPTKLSGEEFRKFKSIIRKLAEDKDVEKEYRSVAILFDVIEELTIFLPENETIKKEIITNDSDIFIMEEPEKLPNSLTELIKEIYLIRTQIIGSKNGVKNI